MTARRQHQRQHQPEMRLVAKRPQKNPGEPRAALQESQAHSQQAGRQKGILAMRHGHEDSRECRRRDQRGAPRNDGANGRQIEQAGDRHIEAQRRQIG